MIARRVVGFKRFAKRARTERRRSRRPQLLRPGPTRRARLRRKYTPATPFTEPVRTVFSAFARCKSCASRTARIAIRMIPWPAPK